MGDFHARLSPSASKRWMTCPGSVRLINALNIEDKSSKYAAEGTVAHEIHEKCILSSFSKQPIDFIGKRMEADGFTFTVNQDMVDAVTESLDYVQSRIAEWELQGDEYRVECRVEVWCSLEELGIDGLDGGTSDLIMFFYEDDTLMKVEVFDYKHGQGVAVEVKDNTQALCYASGVMLLPEVNYHPIDVRITISQPRAYHKDGGIRHWESTSSNIVDWCEEQLVPKANRTHDEDAELVPSEEGCRFCPVAGNCKAQYDMTQELAVVDFASEMLPAPETLTQEQKLRIAKHAGVLRSFIVAVEDQIHREMLNGSEEYNSEMKLVRKTTRRRFVEDAFDPICSPLYDHLEHGEIYEEKARSLTDIEKALKKKYRGKEGKPIVDGIMSDITTKPEGDIVVAPLSDKRKAVELSAQADFTGLDD